jgi:hypothetical protein
MSNGKFLELVESIDGSQASIQRLFNRGADGVGVRKAARWPTYGADLKEAVKFIGETFDGKRPLWQLKEALSTSDFPLLFGDTIDRLMVAKYQTIVPNWRKFLKVSKVRDFRAVKRFKCTRGGPLLDELGPGEDYQADAPSEAYYEFLVHKYGKRRDLLWEALVNDDLGALQDAPDDLAWMAANTEHYIASSQYVANATLYAASGGGRPTNGNKGTSALSLESLETAITQVALFMDEGGMPILNAPKYLVIPPALKLAAKKILTSVSLSFTGVAEASHPTVNVIAGELEIVVDEMIPILDPTNGQTSWYLFGDPGNGWAAEVGFLTGHETPELFMKASNQMALGGGMTAAIDGDFDTDAVAYKVRHVIGGSHANAVGGWRFSYFSDGTMS